MLAFLLPSGLPNSLPTGQKLGCDGLALADGSFPYTDGLDHRRQNPRGRFPCGFGKLSEDATLARRKINGLAKRKMLFPMVRKSHNKKTNNYFYAQSYFVAWLPTDFSKREPQYRRTRPMSKFNSNAIRQSLQKAMALQRSGQLPSAITEYNKILDIEPSNFDALYCLGFCYYKENQHTSALEVLNRALNLRRDVASLFNLRGIVLRSLRRNVEALAEFDNALQLNPD